MSSDEYVDPSSDSEYECKIFIIYFSNFFIILDDNPLKNKSLNLFFLFLILKTIVGKLHELHKKFQAENANNAFSSSSDSGLFFILF